MAMNLSERLDSVRQHVQLALLQENKEQLYSRIIFKDFVLVICIAEQHLILSKILVSVHVFNCASVFCLI